MSKKVRGWVIAAGVVLFVAALIFGAWLWLTRWPYPMTRGRALVQGLTAPVEVLRDRYGVPHLYAQTAEDLFFAQGYVHAQDRFWQMEFWRRLSSGRLSELFGKSTLETDKFLRALGFFRLAQREFELLAPDTRRYLEAYAAGVNAYALKRRPARLGLEFALLALQGVKLEIEPWLPANSIAWAKMMAYDLGANHETERLNLDVLRSVGRGNWAFFFAPYRKDIPFTVEDSELKKLLGAKAGPQERRALLRVFGASGIGSNNWVISGRRTATGKPLLANDMHLSIQMPSIWYEIGLHGVRPDGSVARTEACPFQLRGFSFPGVPGVVAGHNDRIAWGHTNLGGDVQDFFIEKLNPENPDQYEVNGRWVDMEIRTETIEVHKSDEPYVRRVRSTRHGPLLSDLGSWSELGGFTATPGEEFPQGVAFSAVALRWTALEPSRLIDSLLRLDKATNFAEFREALRSWDVPAQNIVYADVDGNIGYQVPGSQPIQRERLARERQEREELAAMEAARQRLLAWDAMTSRQSPEAALYGFFWLKLVEETLRDQYPEKRWPPGSSGRVQNALHYLLQDERNPWWDDLRTPEVKETRDQILIRSFRKGYRAAVKKLGRDMDRWRWGKVHTAEFRNQNLGKSGIAPIERIFNRGPFEVKEIASQRQIIDLGDLGASLMIHTTGQSGHPTHRHYDDFIEPWRDIQYHPTLWERAQVQAAAGQRLLLVPERKP